MSQRTRLGLLILGAALMLASLVLVAAALAPRQAPSIERQPIPATVFVEP